MNAVIITLISFVSSVVGVGWYRNRRSRLREGFIDDYQFPDRLKRKLAERYPHLREDQHELVITALREYFHICNQAGNKMVGMPSQAVDLVWHEFILFTRHYQIFCRKALGRFLHHIPAESMGKANAVNDGIRRTWRISCSREGISSTAPSTLPLLFILDKQLEIDDGFHYVPDCKKVGVSRTDYCATHIKCAAGCSGIGGGCSGGGCSSDDGGFSLFGDGGDGDSGCGSCGGGCGGSS